MTITIWSVRYLEIIHLISLLPSTMYVRLPRHFNNQNGIQLDIKVSIKKTIKGCFHSHSLNSHSGKKDILTDHFLLKT